MTLTDGATLFAPAKLTLSLAVTGTRPDGMHLIDAEMVTLDFGDQLYVSSGNQVSYRGAWTGEGDDDDLVRRALDLVGESWAITVDKAIPAGAGLGGGSADAAAILRAVGFDDLDAAAGLGADVAFCAVGGRARVTGIGEVVEPLGFKAETFTLLTPPILASTPRVYQKWDEMAGPTGEHGNDLEPAAIAAYPELAQWRDQLWEHTDQRPRLAGSGSTWFVSGAFPGEGLIVAAAQPAEAADGPRPGRR